jgi:stress-induced-phosphoprotein 1
LTYYTNKAAVYFE